MASNNDNDVMGKAFDFAEVKTFLDAYDMCRRLEPCHSFRELFASLGPHSTILNRITGLLDALLPASTPGIPTAPGERLKLLFQEEAGRGVQPTELATTIRDRLRSLKQFIDALNSEVMRQATKRGMPQRIARIGAPPTLVTRLLAYVFSDPRTIADPETDPTPLILRVTSGDTWDRLLPQLLLDQLDAVVGYGLTTDQPVYRDPDLPAVNFCTLRWRVKMKLIYHPRSKPKFYSGYLTDKGVDPRYINLRETTLVAVSSWRQAEAMQDLMASAERFGRLHTVRTYDEVLAMVRMGAGWSIVPEMFSGRRIVESHSLVPEAAFERELGIYYRNALPSYAALGASESKKTKHKSSQQHTPEELISRCLVRPDACKFLTLLLEYVKYIKDHNIDLQAFPASDSSASESLNDSKIDAAEHYKKIITTFKNNWADLTDIDWAKRSQDLFPPYDGTEKFTYCRSKSLRQTLGEQKKDLPTLTDTTDNPPGD